mmetsp:Transcript_27587/g.43079  ORF Transcript_27587/g.43079 Transcript_27587/m.43079 type:complete len:430 (-) Transcript_27587:282-1571(-)
MILDIDKTAIYGNDANDLAISLQWMEKPSTSVRKLYTKVLSPVLRPAYEELCSKARKVDVVLYTRRPQMIRYQSCMRDLCIPIRYKDSWHEDGQLYIPPEVKEPEDVFQHFQGPELRPEEAADIKKALTRLLAARDAIRGELDLDYTPTVVVTASDKKVEATAERCGISSENAFLFDDNKGLARDPRVVVVDPLESLPEPQRSKVLAFMEAELPIKSADPYLLDYLEDVKETERAIERLAGDVRWRIPLSYRKIDRWIIPPLNISREDEAVALKEFEDLREALELREGKARDERLKAQSDDLSRKLQKVKVNDEGKAATTPVAAGAKSTPDIKRLTVEGYLEKSELYDNGVMTPVTLEKEMAMYENAGILSPVSPSSEESTPSSSSPPQAKQGLELRGLGVDGLRDKKEGWGVSLLDAVQKAAEWRKVK